MKTETNKAAKHTPRPWRFDGISEYAGELLVRAENGDTVARVCCYGPQSETPFAQAANGSLIAAAPEFFAECKAWLNDDTNDAEFADKLRLIIAKIEGGAA